MLLFMHTSPNNAGNVGQRKYKIEKVKKMRDTYLNKFARVHWTRTTKTATPRLHPLVAKVLIIFYRFISKGPLDG
jgi:hypothetical protein